MKKRFKTLAIAGTIVLGMTSLTGCSSTKELEEQATDKAKVALILSQGGVNDQSFNQSAWKGAVVAEKKYGINAMYYEAKQESDFATNIEAAIDQESDLIIGVGFQLTDAIGRAAKAYPEQKFAIIDGSFGEDIPENVVPILFNEEQSGYSVGLIASKMTKTNKVGFIGGMNIPSVTNFLIGFEKAIKEENPDIQVMSQYANSFTDASKGRAISTQMIRNGVDIIFTAGGGVNNGTIEVSKEAGTKVIGVDMPMNYIMTDTIITSALKNVDTGVELIVKDLVEGNFKGGQVKMFDFSNKGVGFEKTDLIPNNIIEYVETKINE